MPDNKILSITSFQNIPDNNNQYPIEFIERNQAIVLNISEDSVTVGITDKTTENSISTILAF